MQMRCVLKHIMLGKGFKSSASQNFAASILLYGRLQRLWWCHHSIPWKAAWLWLPVTLHFNLFITFNIIGSLRSPCPIQNLVISRQNSLLPEFQLHTNRLSATWKINLLSLALSLGVKHKLREHYLHTSGPDWMTSSAMKTPTYVSLHLNQRYFPKQLLTPKYFKSGYWEEKGGRANLNLVKPILWFPDSNKVHLLPFQKKIRLEEQATCPIHKQRIPSEKNISFWN